MTSEEAATKKKAGPSPGEDTQQTRLTKISAQCSGNAQNMRRPTALPRSHSLPAHSSQSPESKQMRLPMSARGRQPTDKDTTQELHRLHLDSLEQFYDALDNLDLADGDSDESEPSSETALAYPKETLLQSAVESVSPSEARHVKQKHSAPRQGFARPGMQHSGEGRLALSNLHQPVTSFQPRLEPESSFPIQPARPGEESLPHRPVQGLHVCCSLASSQSEQQQLSDGSISAWSCASLGGGDQGGRLGTAGQEFAVSRLEVNDLYYDATGTPGQASARQSMPSPLTEKNLWASQGGSRRSRLESIQRALR